MKRLSELTLQNGETVAIQLGYNPMKCLLISKDFPQVDKIFSVAVGGKDKEASLDMATLAGAVYVAYRQANMQKGYLTFEEFYDEENGYVFDMKEAGQIYTGMLDPKSADKYLQELEKLGKGKKGK